MGNVELKRIDLIFNPDYIFLKNAKITREYFDYFLHDLSSKEAKDKFVEFCKEIIKLEICQNLELYNEEEVKSTAGPLYVGEGINGSKIAFRINTKPNWMKNYEHDMKKYSEEDNDLFSEFYFITYQDIIPKVLFNNETKYLSVNKIQVHLFDRKWLIDKIFEHEIYMNSALESFNLSKNLKYDSEIISYKNQKNALENTLNEIEKDFDDYISAIEVNNSDSSSEKKEVNFSFDDLKNKYDVAISIVDKIYNSFNDENRFNNKKYEFMSKYKKILEIKGDEQPLINFSFDSAVKLFYGDEDTSRFIDCFETLCVLLEKNLTSDLYEINVILWTMLRKLNATPEDRGGFLSRINACYELIISNKVSEEDEIKIVHANNFLDMYTKDEKSKRMDTYSKSLMRTYGYNNIRFYYFAMLFMEDRYYFSENHDLVDICVENLIKVLKEHNISSSEIGRIYLKQAMDATRKNNNNNDMTYYSEALKLFNESENGKYLAAKTLYELGKIFYKKKLYWLSRCVYVYGLTECIKLYEQEGVTSKIFIKIASELKMVELLLGRVMYSTRFYCLEQIIREINDDNVGKSQDTYDFALAVLIYKTPLIKLEQIGKLSRYFEKYGLYYSNIAVKHELGHYDKKLLHALENNKKTFDEYVSKWKQQPVGEDNNLEIEPWYGVEYKLHLKLDFMGCKINLDVENKAITLEYASMLYAALQSVLYKADNTEAQVDKITIYVLYDKESMFNVNVTHSKLYDTQFIIKIGRFDKESIESQQQIVKAHIVEFINNLMNAIFRHKMSYNKIKLAVDEPGCVDRNENIASSFVNALEVFGFSTFNYNLLTSGYDNILSNRSIDDVFPNQNLSKRILELKRRLRATFEKTEIAREKIRHNVVNVNAWDKAVWDTVDIPNKAGNLPIIAFVFKNEKEGKEIFDTWIEKYSEDDKNNYIGIRILKKINAEEPFKYRVVIGNTRKIYNEEDKTEIETPVYTCTVSAENVAKLYTFERLMKTNTHYLMCPAFYDEDGGIIYDWSRIIKKKASSIKCSNVWQIDMNDLLFTEGVFSTDKPVLPHGEESIAILSLIEEKKIRVDVLNAALNMTED